jgi:hypothetical protein
MTIITESLISEYQSQKSICLNDILRKSYAKSLSDAINLDVPFDVNNLDIKKLIKHNLIIDICEFKKLPSKDSYFYISRDEFNEEFVVILDEVFSKMELYKYEKSKNFFQNFRKYLKLNGLSYILNVYLKQVGNKLALFR